MAAGIDNKVATFYGANDSNLYLGEINISVDSGLATANLAYVNGNTEGQKAILIIAVYNNNKLLEVSGSLTSALEPESDVVTVSVPVDAGATKVSAMIWVGYDSMRSLKSTKTISVN